MRINLILAIMLLAASILSRAGAEEADKKEVPSDAWHLVSKAELAKVEVERVLYQKDRERDFLIHVRLTNLTDRPIGAALGDHWNVIYPNHVAYQAEPERFDIKGMIYAPLTEA